LGDRDQENVVQSQVGQKVKKTPISPMVRWRVPVISGMQGIINRRITAQVALGISETLSQNKQTNKQKPANIKRAGRVAQVVEDLPTMLKSLSSTSSITKFLDVRL
jgi:hypothetical protein